MTRANITPSMVNEMSGQHVQLQFLVDLYFDNDPLHLWTGMGQLEWQGRTYFGAGNLLGFSVIEETQDIVAKGITISLTGIPTNIIALALSERTRNRKLNIWIASQSNTSFVKTEDDNYVILENDDGKILLENQFLDSPYRIFSGLMDVFEISDDGKEALIKLSVENALLIGQRNKLRRYTPEQQKRLFPNDKGLDFINELQDKEVVWK